jgi:hypothetical protein
MSLDCMAGGRDINVRTTDGPCRGRRFTNCGECPLPGALTGANYFGFGSTAGLRQSYLVATDLSVDPTCHPAADQARCGRPGAARAVGLDQEYDRQRQVEGQSLWVSALRQSVRCPALWVGMRRPSDQPRLLDEIWIDHVLPHIWWSRRYGPPGRLGCSSVARGRAHGVRPRVEISRIGFAPSQSRDASAISFMREWIIGSMTSAISNIKLFASSLTPKYANRTPDPGTTPSCATATPVERIRDRVASYSARVSQDDTCWRPS